MTLDQAFIRGLAQDCSLRRNPDGRTIAQAVIELLCEDWLTQHAELQRLRADQDDLAAGKPR